MTNGLFLQNETVSPIKDGTLLIEQTITFLLAESKLIINLFLNGRFGLVHIPHPKGWSWLWDQEFAEKGGVEC